MNGKKMAIEDIVVIHDFLTKEEIEKSLAFQKELTENNLWDPTGNGKPSSQEDNWSQRFFPSWYLKRKDLGYGAKKDIELLNMLVEIRKRLKKQIQQKYNIENIYCDSLNLIRWPHGLAQPPHADFENFGLEDHVHNWREIGNVIYLNNDFDGGQIFYPQHNVEVEIKPGMAVFFPGDIHHVHGVKRILNGTRYTISTFWSGYPHHADDLEQ
jgi:hypothetical protein